MKKLYIDIETYSGTEIKLGVTKYTSDPNFEIMLVAYSIDQGPVEIIDLVDKNSERQKIELTQLLMDPSITKVAHNSNFELTCLCKAWGIGFKPEEWQCTMVMAQWLNLPASLEQLCTVLGVKGKLKEGASLIKYFCCPCKETKINGGRTRNLPEHALEKWDLFKSYCIQDVYAEIDVYNHLSWVWEEITDLEKQVWHTNSRINRNGVHINTKLCGICFEADTAYKEWVRDRILMLTSLDNPNSLPQLKAWIRKQDPDLEFDSLDKEHIDQVIQGTKSILVKQTLEIRKLLGKTSTAKYEYALKANVHGRVHDLFRYVRASTWRFGSEGIQAHNLPKNKLTDIDATRNKYLTMAYDNQDPLLPAELSQLIRTIFIPKPKCKFIVVDYSAIEARVLAWVAGEKWALGVFRSTGKIYEATAAKMYHLQSIEEVTKEQRQNGKTGVLACGYMGSQHAIERIDKTIPEDLRIEIVESWRAANPHIVGFWGIVESMCRQTIKNDKKFRYQIPGEDSDIRTYLEKGFLVVKLPSGHKMFYASPRLDVGKNGFDAILYKGLHQQSGQWIDLETYGGKLTENIIQAIARDLLAFSLVTLSQGGYNIVLHVHDEVVVEAEDCIDTEGLLKSIKEKMCTGWEWCKSLPLGAEGFITDYYRKE